MRKIIFALALIAGTASAGEPDWFAQNAPQPAAQRAAPDPWAVVSTTPAPSPRTYTLDELAAYAAATPKTESRWKQAVAVIPQALAFAFTIAGVWIALYLFRASLLPFLRVSAQIALAFGAVWFVLRVIRWAWDTPLF